MRVPIVGLVGHPGRTRPLVGELPLAEVSGEAWGALAGAVAAPVALDLHLDAVVEGILVRGRLATTVVLECARCLAPVPLDRDVEVAELFVDAERREDDEGEPEPGYTLLDAATAIDLTTLVRDALLVDLPVRVLCREDCQGLCPTCGADRNEEDCGHTETPPADPRWAALADLALPPDADRPAGA